MSESLVEKQVRLVQERQCRALADKIKPMLPAGTGFLLFLADLGDDGNMSYVSTVSRESAIKLTQEWLDHQDANHPAEGWETAAMFLMEVANAIGFEGEPEPAAVLARCRELAGKERE